MDLQDFEAHQAPQSPRAPHSCSNCRTLKRRCSRETPACSLCTRLHKFCSYEDTQSFAGEINSPKKVGQTSSLFSLLPQSLVTSSTTFLAPFFLDSDTFRPMHSSAFVKQPVPKDVLGFLGSNTDVHSVYNQYFSGIHRWLPLMSQKERMLDIGPRSAVDSALLVLSMKLLAAPCSESESAATSPLYQMTKELSWKVENCGLISLELVQSTVLLSVYEIGHAIYPAGFLSVARAARLSMIMGFHNRESPQIFQSPETWTRREEERRTWWAILIFDRFINLGVSGLPFATPEPAPGELLPCAEDRWDGGLVGFNQPLFVNALPPDSGIGFYANTCQSAHLLGNVIRHRDNKNHLEDRQSHLLEADQLHRTLVALSSHLKGKCFVDDTALDNSHFAAFALCCSARFILYEIYACNEHCATAAEVRIAEEMTMQKVSIEGINAVLDDVYPLAQLILCFASVSDDGTLSRLSPVFCHCLYQAISECSWLLREEKSAFRTMQFNTMTRSLQTLGRVWNVVGTLVILLPHSGIPSNELLDHYMKMLEVENVFAAGTSETAN